MISEKPVNRKKKSGKRRVRRGVKIFTILFILLIFIDGLLFYGVKQYFPDAFHEKELLVDTKKLKSLKKEQDNIKNAMKDISLVSENGLLIDMSDQSTLYDLNGDQRIYPASLTKVLSAITALDLKDNLKEKAKVSTADLAGLMEENASVAGLGVEDTISYEQALYALILPSGADAANFLANHLTSGNDQFVSDMNLKAQGLGMRATHFTNTTGLHDDAHYTTLQDMKKMMMHAWINPVFQKVMTTLHYSIKDLPSHPEGLDLKSTLLMGNVSLTFDGGKIIGGKTGYTPEAGRCLISIAKMKDGHLYMFLSAGVYNGSSSSHILDALTVYQRIADVRKKEE